MFHAKKHCQRLPTELIFPSAALHYLGCVNKPRCQRIAVRQGEIVRCSKCPYLLGDLVCFVCAVCHIDEGASRSAFSENPEQISVRRKYAAWWPLSCARTLSRLRRRPLRLAHHAKGRDCLGVRGM